LLKFKIITPVLVGELTTSIFVGTILAVGGVVAEKLLVDALAVSTAEFAIGTDRLVCLQIRLHLAGLCVWKFVCKFVFSVREKENFVRRTDERDRLARISFVLVAFHYQFHFTCTKELEEIFPQTIVLQS